MTDTLNPDPDFLRVAGENLHVEEALAVAAGYCFGEEPLVWIRPSSGVGDEPGVGSRGAFAYESYDGVPAGPTFRIEPIDILVANGLNAQMRAKDIAAALAVSEDLSAALETLDAASTCFWELERDAVDTQPTSEAEPGWPLWRAWTILRGVQGIDLARTHKILHHKRPRAFPLIDNKTVDQLVVNGPAWAAIHDDLTVAAGAWEELEQAVAGLALARHLPPPTRLRLHDILLWTHATGKREAALRHGRTILAVVK